MMFKGRRILVTGGAGFIGSNLCRRLLAEGADLTVMVKYNSVMDNVRLLPFWDDIRPLEADLRNPDSLAQIGRHKPEVIFHLAAYNHVGDSFHQVSEAFDSNAKGTINLLDAYEDYERFVYISTSEVYGAQERSPFVETAVPFPLSPYALGKYAGELYARLKWRSLARPTVVLRPFNAFGPYQSPRAVIAETIIACLRGEPLATTTGTQTRDFNFVENLIDGFVLAATTKGIEGEVINIGSGVEKSIRDLVVLIHRLTGSSAELKIGGLPDRPGEIVRMGADATLAARRLGWAPRVDLETGLRRSIDWYRRYLSDFFNRDAGVARLGMSNTG